MLIAITGGIGTGKSVVSTVLCAMGYKVYDCDSSAKLLMSSDEQLKQELCRAFGDETYSPDGTLNKQHLASVIFNNEEAKLKMNSIVHPAVARDLLKKYKDFTNKGNGINSLGCNCLDNNNFQDLSGQNSEGLFFFESAILFESGFDKMSKPDKVISVTAPLELRIARAMKRDSASRESILARIKNQISQEEKDSLADIVIVNNEVSSVLEQIEKMIQEFTI